MLFRTVSIRQEKVALTYGVTIPIQTCGKRKRNFRRSPPPDSFVIMCELGDKLRDQFGEVRYVTRIIHNGDQSLPNDATEYELHGPMRYKLAREGKELMFIHGMWTVKRKK